MSHPRSPYTPRFERGGCGIGFVAHQHGHASHAILRLGLQALSNLQHRGAFAADARTGDGAGVLTPLPYHLFAREAERLTQQAVDPEQLAVGVFFFEPTEVEASLSLAEAAFARRHLKLIAWRNVPVNPAALGDRARATQPRILQAIVSYQPLASSHQLFEHSLYLARKDFERSARDLGAYVPSFSSRTIVYKGLCLAQQLPEFYADLRDPEYAVALTVFHQRYSTNTLPTWARAQPFRVLCHNGEINTLQGNIAWMQAREPRLDLPGFREANLAGLLRPVIDTNGSDSAMLDNVAELLVRGGRDIQQALTMLVPPAWERLPDLPQALRDFYEYQACLTEPWDGPAALVFTDGSTVGATLDRNGLRPCRYLITEDGLVAAASEAGAVPVEPDSIRVQGRLGPGQMLMVDTARGRVLEDAALKAELAARHPYGDWVRTHIRHLSPDTRHASRTPDTPLVPMGMGGFTTTLQQQAAFGYTSEELAVVIKPMVEDQAEALGSMGDDTPLAVLSDKPRPLFSYFRQRFAEVTNPPIDPLRESLVMSLTTRLGARGNFLAEAPEQAHLLALDSPFLTDAQLAALKADPDLNAATLSTLFRAAEGPAGLALALQRLCAEAEAVVRAGAQVVILSDRGVSARYSFIPALLAVSAVHHHLLRADVRTATDVVVESGEPREVHHFATLVGYGAAAVNPYLALTTAAELARRSHPPAEAEARYLHAVEHGLLKIMSKMGISTADAYCGAQIFETVGLQSAVVDEHFAGTPSHLEGLGLSGIADIVLRWHAAAFTPDGQPTLDSPGLYKFKRSGELHAFSPAIVHALHAAVKTPGALNGHWEAGFAAYKHYSDLQHNRVSLDVRDLLEITDTHSAIPSHEVETAPNIVRRFSTAAMSHGALSAEAHATMTIAMNRLGALSNSGEGGEDAQRYKTEGNDRIKQVASARFGVTPAYLVNADELQIKMAQGSKPGEGGQLPGHKVTAEIAAIRHATPGITLISPPPHHDIYSIEDLAQLIYDLRQINPRAVISVKLVAQAGVGTIAAGVAKAGADVILISGNSGGTGASPLSSIKYAGLPWEIGLAEAQYVLIESGLRGQVRLRADGGLRTGRDVVLAALLGADEYSFGTAAVVAEGCLMARACHLNTCPIGIATQKPELRAKFEATPEQVMAFFLYVAEEVREVLAGLGAQSLEAVIGRVEWLRQKADTAPLDASRLLLTPPGDGARRYMGTPNPVPASSPLNEQLLADVERESLLDHPGRLLRGQQFLYHITNRDRTFAARLAGKIAERHGDEGLPADTLRVKLYGSAGQSFGAFGVPGLNLSLTGEANDYVGKGLTGGRIVITPPTTIISNSQPPVLAGNTVLYGATGGELFIAGRAGERFAVRNSGAVAVVEGVGDHGCEYMTGGLVVVLGPIGRNFAAGMTGGVAYVLDVDGEAADHINPQLVSVEQLTLADRETLQCWLIHHARYTGSQTAQAALDEWALSRFVKVAPKAAPGVEVDPRPAIRLLVQDPQKADIVAMPA